MDKILYKKIKNNKFKKNHNIKEKYMVLFFGRLNPTKGPEKLAKAAIDLTKSGNAEDIAFIWVGPDEGKAEQIKEMIRQYKNMKYIGPLRGKEKIAEMYQAADIYVLPSYREGLPLTLFEAMASGLPIIASPVNGIPYEIKQPENGFFVSYGDIERLKEKIAKLIKNKDLRKKISKNNKKKAGDYGWDKIYEKYMKEYKKLINKK
jgi:N,N'-diacetylbacillosaminyl-diphospho-undecaprenol alpha-1,3-N-acetylgalactosaminyltransferase